MKKILLTMILLLSTALSQAQDLDIKPNQQAQGLLESKNAMVDHATGLFHYKVPLYEIKSGNFTLPITLNYIAKGVKVDDQPGLVGYNWTLNTGGVVTRTVRGGIADESSTGIAIHTLSASPTAQEIEDINRRSRDGESDIFTAVFNGQVVNFFISFSTTSTLETIIIATPLERTNVKIECEYKNYEIKKWHITDEYGTKYTFGQIERCDNVNREGAISMNGVSTGNYISSWYASEVKPVNSDPIKYYYRGDVDQDTEEILDANEDLIEQINISTGRNSGNCMYNYGEPLSERPINFDKYKSQYNAAIEQVKYYTRLYTIQLSTNYEPGLDSLSIVRRYIYENYIYPPIISVNYQIIGIFNDLGYAAHKAFVITETINRSLDFYNNCPGDSHIRNMICLYLNTAKYIISACLNEVELISNKHTQTGSGYRLKQPLVNRIECKDRTIAFYYDQANRVTSIKDLDVIKNVIHSTNFEINHLSCLTKISFMGNSGNVYDNIIFDYYNTGNQVIADLYGYQRKFDEDIFSNVVDEVEIKNKTLKSIVYSKDSRINLYYELNKVSTFYPKCSGIRIKTIEADGDKINYSYPELGVPCGGAAKNSEPIRYKTFNDNITYDRMIANGQVIINRGNDGIIYPYVIENYEGKGYNAYHFYPAQLSDYTPSYPYWLNGLPLAKATYSNDKRLISVVKNRYYTDLDFTILYPQHFIHLNSNTKYSSSLPQVSAYRYYINKEETEQQYSEIVDLSPDVSINLYDEVYVRNILPRTEHIIPNQCYNIRYGGKTILKETAEYKFENSSIKEPSMGDFNTASVIPVKTTELFYDDSNLTLQPTRKVSIDSKGNKYTEVNRYIVSLSNTTGVHADMKSKNMLNQIFKNQKLVSKYGTNKNYLISETINQYEKYEGHNVLKSIFSYAPTTANPVEVSSINNTIFEYTASKYIKEGDFDYSINGNESIMIGEKNISESKAIVYELRNSDVLLSSNSETNSVDAVNNTYYINNYQNDLIDLNANYITLSFMFNKFKDINFDNCSSDFKEYLNDPVCKSIFKTAYDIIDRSNVLPYEYIKKRINDYFTEDNIRTFLTNMRPELNNFVPASISVSDFNPIRYATTGFRKMTKPQYNLINLYQKNEYCKPKDRLTVSNITSTKYKICVLANMQNYHKAIQYSIYHSGGSTSGSVPVPLSQDNKLLFFDLDLTPYSNITSIVINNSENTNYNLFKYIALVPADAEFEATSYNADGTVFCKFNQNGQLERYDYDAVGRPTKIFDQDGNLLKEFKYNIVLN